MTTPKIGDFVKTTAGTRVLVSNVLPNGNLIVTFDSVRETKDEKLFNQAEVEPVTCWQTVRLL